MPVRREQHRPAVELDPAKFYSLTAIIQSVDDIQRVRLQTLENLVRASSLDVEKRYKTLADVEARLSSEGRRATKRLKAFDDPRDQEHDLGGMFYTAAGQTFLHVLHTVMHVFQDAYSSTAATISSVRPGRLILSKKKHEALADSYEDLQHMMYEFQLNEPTIVRFINAVGALDFLRERIIGAARSIITELDGYQALLVNRHSVEGVEIHTNPVATDVALTIYENVDAHGEIAEGKDPKEVSAYTINKAVALADAVRALSLREIIKNPSVLISYIVDNLNALWTVTTEVQLALEDTISDTFNAIGAVRQSQPTRAELDFYITSIKDLDPQEVKHRSKDIILSREEKFNLQFKNETLRAVSSLLTIDAGNSNDLVSYILHRKAELRKFFQEENSFYVCKIGHGNPFTMEAPGALSVIPGPRPLANLTDIRGSGFDEVRDFFSQVEHSAKWHDLFVATSPSKSADKSNVLLVGPQGCGKTEVLRAVGGDKKSIGIFAQSSDFLTCWKGEAEKNPKRLFEEGVRLQRESRRHVHFLIDEIDAVLNNERGFGATNLTLEFQILMDGVVQYPHLSVWGTTNVPDRIPMPMIRRFNKVLIVGELDTNDRVHLLRTFIEGFMPTHNFADDIWVSQANRLEGATGDVMRKVVDHIWREKMTTFVRTKPEAAQKSIDWLNRSQKFQVAEFTAKDRNEFKGMLKEHVAVTPTDLSSSITLHLDNVAVQAEIRTAVETYRRSREFLMQIKQEIPA